MPRLSVNVDHVATVRQARLITEPDPVTAAAMAELAGAEGITIHLREDRRHIQDRDLEILRRTAKTRLNLEMAATEEMVGIAISVKPDMVTIVPEKREELTTEGGLDVEGNEKSLRGAIAKLKSGGIQVNLFIDPEIDVVKLSAEIGADGVELHTGGYANLAEGEERDEELKRIAEAAKKAAGLGLKVHAGHGLDYRNIKDVTTIEEIEEYAIGFSIVARSIYVGMDMAVREMVELIG
ncbi:MAG: pyridoxine 5'-phosphate synthase [Thermodesulfobacteriota bacterium]